MTKHVKLLFLREVRQISYVWHGHQATPTRNSHYLPTSRLLNSLSYSCDLPVIPSPNDVSNTSNCTVPRRFIPMILRTFHAHFQNRQIPVINVYWFPPEWSLFSLTMTSERLSATNKMALDIFFDFGKAYNSTWRMGVLHNLHSLGFRDQLPPLPLVSCRLDFFRFSMTPHV